MAQATNTLIDKGLYDIFNSPLYKRDLLAKHPTSTTIIPRETWLPT